LGEIALDRDWLTSAQLERLLATQRDRRVLLGDLLVKQGCLSRAQMNAAIADFERLDAEQTGRLASLLANLPDSAVIRALLDYTVSTCCGPPAPVKISLTFERSLHVNHREGQPLFQHATGAATPLGLVLASSRCSALPRDTDRKHTDPTAALTASASCQHDRRQLHGQAGCGRRQAAPKPPFGASSEAGSASPAALGSSCPPSRVAGRGGRGQLPLFGSRDGADG
jgi:hypothetical protein